MRGFSAVYGAGLGWRLERGEHGPRAGIEVRHRAASPRISSMVRSMDVVLYMVLSTAWRFT